ncbi:MAG: hypothetical protein AB1Y25_06460 [Cycloclasticus sp.]
MTFIQQLRQQRWDDHRYYHHNRINQFLHLLSAICFLTSYILIFPNPILAVMVGWLLAMVLRQSGHFFFEPLVYDDVNQASQEYKESVKVGYNLHRKLVLISIWLITPFVLMFDNTFFSLFSAPVDIIGYLDNIAYIWLMIGIGAIIFRMIQLVFIKGIQASLVWGCKILTDPFHDIFIYYKAPYYLLKGEMYDEMTEWYESTMLTPEPGSKSQ